MNSRMNIRFPLFEISMLLVVVGIGWAAYRVYQALQDSEKRASVQKEPLDFSEPMNMQELLKLQALLDFKDRFVTLAEQLTSGLKEMRQALERYLQDKNRTQIATYLKTSQSLSGWIDRQKDNLDPRKERALAEWLSTQRTSTTTGQGLMQFDLEILLTRAESALSNYAASIRINEGQVLTPDAVQKKLNKAAEYERELLAIAAQANIRAAALEGFVSRRSAELEIKQRPRDRAPVEALPSRQANERTLQLLLYGLFAALVFQCSLLFVSFYRRTVVAPLHQKLLESHTTLEHQKKLDHFARLATGLAHEIRNPLTAINVRLFTLQKSLAPGTAEHSDATLIRNEIDRLEQILKNFLNLARPTEPKFAVMTAGPFLNEVRELLAPHLQRRGITLTCQAAVDTPFRADPSQLKQVLINLVQNAADSIGQDGTIMLRACAGEVNFQERPSRAVFLEVEDTGTGISAEVQERLFDPFFSTKENGTGLGLPIAVKIIGQHRGLLDFQTYLGRGTTFQVKLPVYNPKEANV
jgi:signal transduction histidine kinase